MRYERSLGRINILQGVAKKILDATKYRAKAHYISEESSTDLNDTDSTCSSSEAEQEFPSKDKPRKKVNRMGRVFKIAGMRRAKRTKGNRKRNRWDFKVEIAIKGQIILMTTDTGADINVLLETIADKLKLPLEGSRIKLCPYGAKPFRVAGKYEGSIAFGDRIATAKWYIVKRSNIEPLLSGKTAEDLGIIKFSPKTEKDNAQVQSTTKNKKNNSDKCKHYFTKYSSIFHGVGTLKNYEVKLFVVESVRPVAEPPRPIPFHLKDRCDQELEKMEVEGIIEPHTGPAPWISNLVMAPKDDGNIRITVDMRNVNKAIQNTRIPIPKVDDIKAKLSGSKFFTKLDLKSVFHQLTLE